MKRITSLLLLLAIFIGFIPVMPVSATGSLEMTDATQPTETTPGIPVYGLISDTPSVGVAYKWASDTGDKEGILSFIGTTANKDYYLSTSTNMADGVDVYVEAVTGGYRLYFMAGNTKTYIDIYQSGTYVNARLTTEPTAVFTWNSEFRTFVADIAGTPYYLGTYTSSSAVTYTTLNASKLSYMNADNVDVTQFPVRFYEQTGTVAPQPTTSATTPTTAPTEPTVTPTEPTQEPTDPAIQYAIPEVGVAYKFFLTQKNLGKTLYLTGEMNGFYFATTENVAEAADVFVEKVSGGYRLYFIKDGVKNYIEMARSGTHNNVIFTTTPSKTLKWNAEIKSFTCDLDVDGEITEFYFGTYNTFNTFSASKISYVTGDKADTMDVSNFVARLIEVTEIPIEPTEPTTPPTEPAPGMTMQQIVDMAYELAPGASMTDACTLTGVVTEIKTAYNFIFKTVTVVIAVEGREDKPILCYYMDCGETSVIGIGDTITVTGYLCNYFGTVEFVEGCTLDFCVRAEDDGMTMQEIVDAAYELKSGAYLGKARTLTGVVTGIVTAYNDIMEQITVIIVVGGREDKPIQCYRMKGELGSMIGIGDTITVTGNLYNYRGIASNVIEFAEGCTLDSHVKGDPTNVPEQPTQTPTEEPTVAPTEEPTVAPTEPTVAPTEPTVAPTEPTTPTTEPVEDPWYLEYEIANGEAIITDCDQSVGGEIIIPDTLGGYPVTSIGDSAFYDCSSLTSVTIPDGVTSIGDSAFWYCTSLTSITIPDGVTSIGDGAFGCCTSLTSITIPDGVTSIGDYAFYDCRSLTSVTIPDGVTSIGVSAFYDCTSLTSITIPDGVTSIGNSAFENCWALTDVYYGGTEAQWVQITIGASNEYLTFANIHCADTDITAPSEAPRYLTYEIIDGEAIITGCDLSVSGEIIIPATLGGYPVTGIGESAFLNCQSLTSITIPDSVTTIGGWAFFYCKSMTSVTIPDSVTSIGEYAFYSCESLINVYYGGTEAQWAQITIGTNNENLTSANIDYADTDPTAPPEDPWYLEYEIANGEAIITDCDQSVGGEIIIPDTLGGYPVTTIGNFAFRGCSSLTSITIPDSVTSIGEFAFAECSSLTNITIPDSVTSIGWSTFSDCDSLTSITIPDSVTTIGKYAFSCCDSLTSVTIPNSVTSIGDSAFYDCINLTSVTIPDSVTSIGWQTFYGCSSLTSITIPDGVTSIGDYAFYDCRSLTDVYYGGTNAEWARIGIEYGNERLTSANIHFTGIEPAKITSQPKTAMVKVGATAKFTVKASGEGLKYQWQSSADGKTWKNCSSSSATKATFSFTSKTSHNGNYYRCKVTDGASNVVYTTSVRLYVLGVTTQPKTQTVKSGATVKFTVKATGDGLKYQWQSSADGKTWKNCSSSSATKATFSFTSKTSHNGNYYRCRVTDSAGNKVYTSAVRLYVLGITTQPTTQTVKSGATIKYTVKATGTGLKYQWQSSADGKTWKNCSSSSATKATFSFTSKTSHNGNYYRCKVTDSAGNVVYTDAVRLYVLGVTTQPTTQKVKAGATVKFTVKATGTGLKYQWQSSTDGKTWKNCSSSSATKATFSFTSKTSHSGNYYRCKVTDSAGNVVYTDSVRLYVLGITEQPVKKTVTKGKTAKFEVEATGHSVKYQWQVSTDGGKTFKNCSSTSAKKATFSFTTKTSHNGNYYRCKITDSAKNSIYTSKVKLTVK